MDKQARPLDHYFEAARREPGISEQEVRAIVHDRTRAAGDAPALRRLGAALGVAAVVAVGVVLLDGEDPAPKTARIPSPAASAVQPSRTPPGDSAGAAARDSSTTGAVGSTNETSTIISSENTMNTRSLVRGVATAALAVAMNNAAPAQQADTGEESSKKVRFKIERHVSPVVDEMAAELGRSAADFWTERLNAYKSRIDRMLSPADLEKLNRMRVRFGVMVNSATASAETRKVQRDEENIVLHRRKAEGAEEREEKVRKEVHIEINGGGPEAMELFTLHGGAKEIAANYRQEFDALGRDVMEDFVRFLREMKAAGARFMKENRAEIEKVEDGREISLALDEADDVIAALESEEDRAALQMMYAFAVEPLVMLYDGAELRSFFSKAGPLSSAVTGLNLPEMSALRQNVPNPASSTTTIAYSLGEASSSTVLRLYDASGSLVGTYDQGAREAGDHAATIDLSSLAPGVYLYHLTVSGASGSRVYSKAMQVAK